MSVIVSKIKHVNGREVQMSDAEHADRQAESDANLIQSGIDANNEKLNVEIKQELESIMPDMLAFVSSQTDAPQKIKDANTRVVDKSSRRT